VAEHIKKFEIKEAKSKVIAVSMILLALLFGWLSVSWQIGNMFASLTAPNDPNAEQIAELSHGLSPRDPMTNWLKASVEKEVFTPEHLARAVDGFVETVRLAPADYRYWLELARALEQAEKYAEAEKAFRQSLELAPGYSSTRWLLGNFYLRQGREADAFAELRRAAETNSATREQFFAITWDYYEGNGARLEELAGDQPDVRAGLAKFYAGKERPEESLRIWNTLDEDQKRAHRDVARAIAQSLYEKGFYRSGVEFVRQLEIEPQAQAETVQNGGFEAPIPENSQESFFNWRIFKLDKIDVRTDPTRKKEGARSLRVSFSAFLGVEIKNIGQIVTVEPEKKYALSFWLRTENLKSAGTPTLEIVNAADNKIIVTSPPFPSGSNEWAPIKVEFAAPAGAEAVVLRIDRAYCGDACPITGAFWVDEFKLERTN
jgi:tetratricopeptide (TPR) repeat protein